MGGGFGAEAEVRRREEMPVGVEVTADDPREQKERRDCAPESREVKVGGWRGMAKVRK